MSAKSVGFRAVNTAASIASSVVPGLSARLLARLFTTPMKGRVPEREAEWLASAKRSRIPFDKGRELAVYTWGEEGPVVLLIHGWSGRASQLGLYAEPLVALGFQAVAFDAPGHGNSDGRSSSLPEFAKAVQHVAKELGSIEAVIAHSMGTAATTIALSWGMHVERLEYLAPPENLPGYLERLAGLIGFSDKIAELAQQRLEKRFGVPFEDARGATLAPKIDVALLAFHDETDREVPIEEGQKLVASWPGADLVVTQGLGHNRIIRDPGVVEQIIAFLTKEKRAAREQERCVSLILQDIMTLQDI